jgi:3-deoxy-D-manno-octulosonic-acid transferase
MYLLYGMLLVIWGLALLPVFLYKAMRQGKRLPGMRQRVGRLPEHLRSDPDAHRDVVWFHSCSVGETLSLEPLTRKMRRRLPEARFLFSTVTKTGHEIAVRSFGAENVFYFPIDFAFVIRRVLDFIQPSMIVIIDTEIWPNLLRHARSRGIPVALANGRISSNSFRYYRWARPALRRVFKNYAALMMQSEEDARRIAALGAPLEIISTPGNMKFDRGFLQNGREELRRDLAEKFIRDIDAGGAPLIVAGSTHPGEESILVEVLRELRRAPEFAKTRLCLAPRHPERFDEAAGIAETADFTLRRRSQPYDENKTAQALLLDTLGELTEIYYFADIVFVGGTLIRHGGHSILEPAAFSKAVVVGPSMENFRAIRDEFIARGALRQITATEDDRALQKKQLLEIFRELLQNAEERETLGRAAFAVIESNRGSAERIAGKLIDCGFANNNYVQ